MARYNFTSERARLRIERILALLKVERLTVREIAARLHADPSGINPYMIHLREAPRRIHIAEYDEARETGERALARYALGDEPDAPYPKKSKATYWQEIKANPERLAKVRESGARTREKRRGRNYLIRETRRYDPPLIEQVQSFVEAWPGNTTRTIADKLDATYGAVKQSLSDLKRRGVLTYQRRTRAGAMWEAANRQRVQHAPIVTKQQGIFAALGV